MLELQNRLIISAPFGNYIQPRGSIPTLGTFTAEERPGRWFQVARTVRFYPHLGAWVNKIGLRNPGINSLAGRTDFENKIVSIHGFTESDWLVLLSRVRRLGIKNLELNLSCPNVGEEADYPDWLFEKALAICENVIVKIPPVRWWPMTSSAVESGIRIIHACNTLPVPAGGMSGKPLKPISQEVVRELRGLYPGSRISPAYPDVKFIGGGGILTGEDIDEYRDAGASAFAVGTGALQFWRLPALIEKAMG